MGERTGGDETTLVHLAERAVACWTRGQPDEALALAGEVLDRAGPCDHAATALAHLVVASGHVHIWRLDEAARHARDGLAAAERSGDPIVRSRAMLTVGWVWGRLGDHATAIACLLEQLRLSRQIGDRLGEMQALHGLGVAYGEWDLWDDGEACLDEALEIAGAVGGPASLILIDMAVMRLRRADYAAARELAERALADAGPRAGGRVLVLAGHARARAAAAEGRYELAAAVLRETDPVAEALGEYFLTHQHLLWGRAMRGIDLAASTRHYELALDHAERALHSNSMHLTLKRLAENYALAGRPEDAYHLLLSGLDRYASTRAVEREMRLAAVRYLHESDRLVREAAEDRAALDRAFERLDVLGHGSARLAGRLAALVAAIDAGTVTDVAVVADRLRAVAEDARSLEELARPWERTQIS